MHTFINAWEIAIGRSTPGTYDRLSSLTGPSSQASDAIPELPTVGSLGLVADLSGWSYADQGGGSDDGEFSEKSLVALTRAPRMVVEYYVVGQSPPFVRGAFIADPVIDEVLRQTEPKAHDAWLVKAEEGEVDPGAAEIAKHVLGRIRTTVFNHRTKLRPSAPPPEEINLPFLNDVMRKVMSGMGKGVRQPIADTRPISIHLEHQPRESPLKGRIEMAGSATYGLSSHHHGDKADVALTMIYRFVEDDRVGERAVLSISAPEGFVHMGEGLFMGTLRRDQEARLSLSPSHMIRPGQVV